MDTQQFLRRLRRFNEEVERSADGTEAMRERVAACRDAEAELRDIVTHRDAGHDSWQYDELDERIARASAETQVWALIAVSPDAARLHAVWDAPQSPSPTWQAPRHRLSLATHFFSVARVRDNSYRFWTLTPAH